MSSRPIRAVARVLFWRYKRGSWQYDVACAVILLFIFLTPKSVFDGSYFADDSGEGSTESQLAEESAPVVSFDEESQKPREKEDSEEEPGSRQ